MKSVSLAAIFTNEMNYGDERSGSVGKNHFIFVLFPVSIQGRYSLVLRVI